VGVSVRGRGRGKVRVRVRAEVRARVGVGVRVRVGHLRRDGQRGEGPRLARELLAQRVDMVEVDVRIADAMHEVAALEAARVREQAGEQRVARDVEGDTYAFRVGVGVGVGLGLGLGLGFWRDFRVRVLRVRVLKGTPRPRSAERWYIWHESSPG